MPFGLYGMGGPDEDPATQQIMELLASLERAPQEPPPVNNAPQPSTLQNALFGGTPRNFVGSLGDAIAAMASVKAGGAPPSQGAYAAAQERAALEQAKQMEAYRQRQEENAAAERSLRNTIRVSTFQEGQKLKGEKELANIRAKNTKGLKSEFTRDVGGVSHRFMFLTDPTSGERMPVFDPKTGQYADELDLGPAGYAPAIIPGMLEGQATVVRVPRNTGPATPITGAGGARLEPPVPTGLVTGTAGQAGVVSRIPEVMDVFNQADASVRGNGGKLDQVMNWVQAKGAQTSAGPIVAPPELVNFYRSVRSILFPYVKSISGAQFPEEELKRYESQFPIPGVDSPEEAAHAWEVVIDQMVTDIKAKYGAAGRTAPSMTKPVDPAVQEYQQYLDSLKQEMGAGANPTP